MKLRRVQVKARRVTSVFAANLKTANEDDVRGKRQRCIDMFEIVDLDSSQFFMLVRERLKTSKSFGMLQRKIISRVKIFVKLLKAHLA